jgi:hypothetical protein
MQGCAAEQREPTGPAAQRTKKKPPCEQDGFLGWKGKYAASSTKSVKSAYICANP